MKGEGTWRFVHVDDETPFHIVVDNWSNVEKPIVCHLCHLVRTLLGKVCSNTDDNLIHLTPATNAAVFLLSGEQVEILIELRSLDHYLHVAQRQVKASLPMNPIK